MHDHCSGRHNEGIVRGYGERAADGMAPAKHKGHSRFAQRRDHLRDGKSRLHISAYGIQKNQKPVDLIVVLDPCESRQNMLIFGVMQTICLP